MRVYIISKLKVPMFIPNLMTEVGHEVSQM